MHPGSFLLLALLLLVSATFVGRLIRLLFREPVERERDSLKTLEGAILALLGLLLGFTFSMAVSRYDQRKQLEIAEANNLGTLWLRTSVLSDSARDAERSLMRRYLPVRMEFLEGGRSSERIARSLQQTGQLQTEMWRIASAEANTRRDPESALFLTALNDSIDVTESRTAALENHIPASAWGMLLLIGAVACVVFSAGLSARSMVLRGVLPLIMAASLALIYDLDSPRSGLIVVHQQSMERLQQQINATPGN
jgi:CDP-diglyceride synthetase